jgi:hypothetical protein
MKATFFVIASCAFILFLSTTSRGDVATTTPPAEGSATEAGRSDTDPPAFAELVGMNVKRTDPGPGPWSYEQLTPNEKAYVDRNRDTTGQAQICNEFTKAATETAQAGRAQAAQAELGVENLAGEGVVP